MEEDKQMICNALALTLRLTRNQNDLKYLRYYKLKEDPVQERVDVIWDNGAKKIINVTLDSGTTMIRDIVNRID
jgi:hypothetical protein